MPVPAPAAVTDAMREVDAAIERSTDRALRHKYSHTAGSRRTSYRRALRAVYDVAGPAATHELARWIVEEVERVGRPPSGRRVRRQGAAICRAHGHQVSTGAWLGA